MAVRLQCSAMIALGAWLSMHVALAGVMPDAFEPDDAPEMAKPIVMGDVDAQSRTFDVIGDVDYIKFYLLRGLGYQIEYNTGDSLAQAGSEIGIDDICKVRVVLLDAALNPVTYTASGDPIDGEVNCSFQAGGGLIEIARTFFPGEALGGEVDVVVPEGIYYIRVDTISDEEFPDEGFVQVTGDYSIRLADVRAPDSGRLRGTIVDALSAAPLEDVIVLARTVTDQVLRRSGISVPDGTFEISPEVGDYQIQLSRTGYQTTAWLNAGTVLEETPLNVGTLELQPLAAAQAPDVSNLQVQGTPTTTSAGLVATVDTGNADTTVSFEYRIGTGNWISGGSTLVTSGGTSASRTVSGLTCGTGYEARVSAQNSAGSDPANTADEFTTFSTASCPVSVPGVSTPQSSSVGADSALLSVDVQTNGASTDVKFQFRVVVGAPSFTDTAITQLNHSTSAQTANRALTGLNCETLYEYRAVATNSAGSTTSASTPQFTTSDCPAAPDISVSPTSLGFGNRLVVAGASGAQQVTISNLGDANLSLSSVGIIGTHAADFAITADSGETTLTPAASRTLSIAFDPSGLGSRNANLRIQSNDADESTVNVSLAGTGTDAAPTISAPASVSMLEDAAGEQIAITVGDLETPAGSLVLSATSSNTALISNAALAAGLGGSGADRTLTITPAVDAFGTATLTLSVSDGAGNSTQTQVALTVTGVNDVPSFTLASNRRVHSGGTTGTQTVIGFANGDPGPGESAQNLTYTVTETSDPSGIVSAAAIASNGTLTYTLSGVTGSATLQIVLQDNGGIANGGVDIAPAQFLQLLVGDGADLSVEIGRAPLVKRAKGGVVEYAIRVTNNGPLPVDDVRILVPAPVALTGVSWTCAAPFDCVPASGSTSADVTVDLSVAQAAEISLLGTPNTSMSFVEITASASMPADIPVLNRNDDRRVYIEPAGPDAVYKAGFE